MALRTNNCKFIMTYMDDLVLDTKYHCPDNIIFLQNQIKPFLTNFDGSNFLQWSQNKKFPISSKWHPLEEAHQAAFDFWLPKVSTLLNTHAKEDYLYAFK